MTFTSGKTKGRGSRLRVIAPITDPAVQLPTIEGSQSLPFAIEILEMCFLMFCLLIQ
jgi:hypothetical protein